MDFIINFLGVNPYQAIAVPVVGGLASGSSSIVDELILGYFGNLPGVLRTWYSTLQKSPYNPPDWIYPPVWASLYVTMGYSSHLVARIAMETLSEPKHLVARSALGIYIAQLGVNLLWSPLFFGARNPLASLLDIGMLGGLVGAMAWSFAGVDSMAGWLCMPYLCWVGFACYLNYAIVKLNPGNTEDKKK